MSERSALLHDVVRQALKAGADSAEAVVAESWSLSVGVRLGELEEAERSESRDLGLRVWVGRKQASVSASDLSPATRERLVERAVAMARLAPDDPFTGLAPKELLAGADRPDLQLYDPTEPTPEGLEALALEAEDAARAVAGVTNSEGAAATWGVGDWTYVTSDGFEGAHRGSSFSLHVGVIASDDGGMERGGEGRSTRWREDLPGAVEIGRTAGERAASRLGARKLESRTAPVIFENRVAMALIGPLLGAISGPAVARGVSFLKDRLGERIFPAGFEVLDDPFRPRGLGSAPFDDEGVRVQARKLIDDGVLTSWLLNTAAARQLGLTSTGHASRGLAGPPGVSTHNLTVRPGDKDLKALMRDAGSGLLVANMFGPSLNANTGDWSTGVSGFWFEDGEIAYPVSEITVAGDLNALYARLVPGSDLEIRGASNAPSLLVDAVAIAGL